MSHTYFSVFLYRKWYISVIFYKKDNCLWLYTDIVNSLLPQLSTSCNFPQSWKLYQMNMSQAALSGIMLQGCKCWLLFPRNALWRKLIECQMQTAACWGTCSIVMFSKTLLYVGWLTLKRSSCLDWQIKQGLQKPCMWPWLCLTQWFKNGSGSKPYLLFLIQDNFILKIGYSKSNTNLFTGEALTINSFISALGW